VCPKHGEVPSDEIVQGYEVAKGKYVEFEKEEFDELRTEEDKTLTIDAFVSSEEIDPIYFDGRMYYLMPNGPDSAEPYALLEAAMAKKKRWGVGQVVFSGREQLAVVLPIDGVLSMAMLNYDAEIRKPSEIKSEFTRPRITGSKLRLAEDLIGKWQDGDFDYSAYKDTYREKVKDAIAAKAKGVEVTAPEEEGRKAAAAKQAAPGAVVARNFLPIDCVIRSNRRSQVKAAVNGYGRRNRVV
jgi:DNA end-binding protein Ku